MHNPVSRTILTQGDREGLVGDVSTVGSVPQDGWMEEAESPESQPRPVLWDLWVVQIPREVMVLRILTGLVCILWCSSPVFAILTDFWMDVPVFDPFKTLGLGTLRGVAVCPAGGCFFTTSGDGLQLWSMKGKLLSTLISGSQVQAEWSPDGSRIAAALGNGSYMILSADGRVLYRTGLDGALPRGKAQWAGDDAVVVRTGGPSFTIWGLVNKSVLGKVHTSNGYVWGVSWSHNSSLAVVYHGAEEGLYIYDTRDWSVRERIDEGSEALDMAWSMDDTKLAWVSFLPDSWETWMYIWDMVERRMIAERSVWFDARFPLWSPDGTLLALDCFDWVRIYNATSLDPLFSLGPLPLPLVSMSWLPDGSGLMTGSRDGSVMIWDTSPTTPSQVWCVEESGITRVRYAPNGVLALGLSNGTLRGISGPNLGHEDFSVEIDHSGGVSSLDWSPSSAEVAAGYESGLVAIWTHTGGLERSWTGHPGGVLDLGWAPSGETLATVGNDGYLAMWDSVGGVIEKRMLDDPVSLAWSPNGSMIGTSHIEGITRIWSYPGLDLVTSFSGVGSLAFLQWAEIRSQLGAGWLAGAFTADEGCLVWWVEGGKDYRVELGQIGEVTDLSWSPSGLILATCSVDGCVRLWDMAEHSAYHVDEIAGLVNTYRTGIKLTSVDWSPDSGHIAASSRTRLYRWDTGQRILFNLEAHSFPVVGLSWSPNSASIAYTAGARQLGIYHTASDKLDRLGIENMPEMCQITCLDWSPDGTRIAVGDLYGTVRVIDPAGILLFTAHHPDSVSCVEWSPDSRYLASGSHDRTIKIWDGYTGSLVLTLYGHTFWVACVSWSPDGRWLASHSCQIPDEVRIWDLLRGECYTRFEKGSRTEILDVAWSPDCVSIAMTTFDTDAKEGHIYLVDMKGNTIWDRAMTPRAYHVSWSPDGSQLAFSIGYQSMVLSGAGGPVCNLTGDAGLVEWSPDGRYIATGGFEGVLRLYDAISISQLPGRIQPLLCIMMCPALILFPKRLKGRRREQ